MRPELHKQRLRGQLLLVLVQPALSLTAAFAATTIAIAATAVAATAVAIATAAFAATTITLTAAAFAATTVAVAAPTVAVATSGRCRSRWRWQCTLLRHMQLHEG